MAIALPACRGLQATEAQGGGVEQPRGGDDRAGEPGGLGVDAERVLRLEAEVALDAEAEAALQVAERAEPQTAELRAAVAEIGETEL